MMIGRRKRRHGFLKFAVGVVVVAAVLYGGRRAWDGLYGRFAGGTVEARAAGSLDKAQAFLNADKPQEAIKLLAPLAEKTSGDNAPRVLMMLARAESMAGHPDRALTHLERATRDFPSSPDQPRAALAYARALEDQGRLDEATRIYEEVRDTAPPEIRTSALAGLGRSAEARKDRLAAREFYRAAVKDARWDSPEWHEALSALGRTNVALIFSPEPTPESQIYAVQRGDSLTSIGNKLNTTQGLLMRANEINEFMQLDVGQSLKYTPKDFRIVIERSKCRLFLLDKDGIFKMYAAGLGMPGHETTLGTYTIGNKQKDPVWHKPGEAPIPAGDPRNELGTRWMPLVPTREGLPTDLGIHGTIHPETVGQFSSHGCARLAPAEVEELFDLVVRGTPVEIVEVFEPTRG
jgi:tetratricopeptide (TPR) repeat protein